jgi:hypothetical protein
MGWVPKYLQGLINDDGDNNGGVAASMYSAP